MKIIRSIILFIFYFFILFLVATVGVILFNVESSFIKDIAENKILFKIIAYIILFSSPYFMDIIRNKNEQQIDDFKNIFVGITGFVIVGLVDLTMDALQVAVVWYICIYIIIFLKGRV